MTRAQLIASLSKLQSKIKSTIEPVEVIINAVPYNTASDVASNNVLSSAVVW